MQRRTPGKGISMGKLHEMTHRTERRKCHYEEWFWAKVVASYEDIQIRKKHSRCKIEDGRQSKTKVLGLVREIKTTIDISADISCPKEDTAKSNGPIMIEDVTTSTDELFQAAEPVDSRNRYHGPYCGANCWIRKVMEQAEMEGEVLTPPKSKNSRIEKLERNKTMVSW